MKKMNHSKTTLNKKRKIPLRQLRYLSAGVLFFFANCTVSLAPKFDQGIVDNLSSASAQVFQLFAEVSSGTLPAEFPLRAQKYNSLIGTLEALKLQVNARPVPQNKTVNKIIAKANERLTQRGATTLISAGDLAPSATALEQILANLTKMKETDQKQGLRPLEVQAFKGNIQLY
ncbi:MAG: hypothetical protein M3015_02470, partial [Bacteroidota bacterium]|nr:hypothetical protein [Bacteroidota bacterium]